jgi:nucleoside-diphosphate-sugar epimerase
MRVFVTGGSGFIGQRLVAALVAGGHEVVCLSRSGTSSAKLAELGADVLSGNLTDPGSIAACVREARPTHIAHTAAEIATQRSKEQIERVNIQGTRALIDACRDLEGLERFLFLSTVVRGRADGQTFREDDVIPATTAYGKSKQLGDEMVFDAHREWGFPGIVLRPSHVYGAGGWFADMVSSKIFRIPGSGENFWDLVHVDDVVSACCLLLESGPVGEAFHVVGDEPVTMKQVFGKVAAALNRKPFGHVPVFAAKLLKGAGTIDSVIRSAKSSNEKLKGLGWAPAHPSSTESIQGVVTELTKPAGEAQDEGLTPERGEV